MAPAGGGVCSKRRYVGDTLVMKTEWVSQAGSDKTGAPPARPRPMDGAFNSLQTHVGCQTTAEDCSTACNTTALTPKTGAAGLAV